MIFIFYIIIDIGCKCSKSGCLTTGGRCRCLKNGRTSCLDTCLCKENCKLPTIRSNEHNNLPEEETYQIDYTTSNVERIHWTGPTPGPTELIREKYPNNSITILNSFQEVFTTDIINLILRDINKRQSDRVIDRQNTTNEPYLCGRPPLGETSDEHRNNYYNKWKSPFTAQMFNDFLGIMLAMGLNPQSRLSDYWTRADANNPFGSFWISSRMSESVLLKCFAVLHLIMMKFLKQQYLKWLKFGTQLLNGYYKDDLRKMCKDRNLPVRGTVAEMRERLEEYSKKIFHGIKTLDKKFILLWWVLRGTNRTWSCSLLYLWFFIKIKYVLESILVPMFVKKQKIYHKPQAKSLHKRTKTLGSFFSPK